MKILQRYLAIALAGCIVGAIYLSFREVALPDVSRIDRTLTEGEPRQEPSAQPAFTALIKGYTYTLVPRATYEISGLVVSQHRGDALVQSRPQDGSGEHPGRLRRLGGIDHEWVLSKGPAPSAGRET